MSQYDEHGRLKRTAAVEIIKNGGSVAVGGTVYATVESLPSEADFAKGNKAAEADARKRIEATIADGQAQLKSLDADAKADESVASESAPMKRK